MRSLMFLAAVVVAGAYFAAYHLPTGDAYAGGRNEVVAAAPQQIQSVSIDTPTATRESKRLPLSELRSLLTSKPGDMLDESKLDADRRALQDALVARGYLAARVAPASVTFDQHGGAFVVFDIDRGPLYRFRTISVVGPGERDASVVTLSSGDDALPSRIEHAKQALADMLASRSRSAHVEVITREDPATASLDVELVTSSTR